MPFEMWTRQGPRNYVLYKGPDPPPEGAHVRGITSAFPCLLLTSVLIGRPQKQSNVTLNFTIEKSSAMRPIVKILRPLDIIIITHVPFSHERLGKIF